MKYILNATVALGMIAAVPAFAQSQSQSQPSTTHNQSSTASTQGTGQTNSAAQGTFAHKLQQDLQQSGFKNVRVMPESFLVRAEDKDGHPVMMVVNPDSVTAITQMSNHSGAPGSSGSSSPSLGSNGGSAATNGSASNSTPSK